MIGIEKKESGEVLKHIAIRYGFLLLLLGLVVFFSACCPRFCWSAFGSIHLPVGSHHRYFGTGGTATLVVGGFDLSIGSVATTALMLSAYVMVVMEQSVFVAVVACLVMGAVVGLINGLLIVKARVPDLLATLGMMFLLIGLQRIPTEGRSISTGMRLPSGETAEGSFSEFFLLLGRHRFDFILPDLIPVPWLFFLLLGCLFGFFCNSPAMVV